MDEAPIHVKTSPVVALYTMVQRELHRSLCSAAAASTCSTRHSIPSRCRKLASCAFAASLERLLMRRRRRRHQRTRQAIALSDGTRPCGAAAAATRYLARFQQMAICRRRRRRARLCALCDLSRCAFTASCELWTMGGRRRRRLLHRVLWRRTMIRARRPPMGAAGRGGGFCCRPT